MLSLQQVTSAISTLKFNLNKSNIGVNTKLSKKKAELILHMMKRVMNDQELGANSFYYDTKCDYEDKADIVL